MTPDERQMLMDLFDRMRAHGKIEKDRDAEQLIWNEVRQIPDSAYMLVQSVLVQEEALKAANARVEELEAQVRALQERSAAPSTGGGFLRRGGSQPASPWGNARNDEPARPASPWGNAARNAGAPVTRDVPPMGQPQAQAQAPQQRSGGGFLKSAMATAAGVAGGMILMDSIKGMMGMGGPQGSGTATAGYDDAAQDAAQDAELAANEQYNDPSNNDPGNLSETSDGGWGDGGGDDGSFEL